MSYFYLVASLPSLSMDEPPPCSVEDFLFQCQGVLEQQEFEDLAVILNGDPADTSSPATRAWKDADTQLRNQCAANRASAYGVDPRTVQRDHAGYDTTIERMVSDAFSRENPLEKERILDRCRWQLAEDLALREPFGFAPVVAHGIKLQLAVRWSAMTDVSGEATMDKLISSNLEREGYLTEFEVEIVSP